MKRPYELPRRPHAALVPAARGVRSGITAQLEDELRARGSRRRPGCPATLWSSAPPKPHHPIWGLWFSPVLCPLAPPYPPMRSPPLPISPPGGSGPRLPTFEESTLPICPSGRLWASLGLGFPTLRAGGSRRGDVGAQAGLWTWDLHQPRGQKRRSSRPRRRRAADAGGMAGARRRPGRPRSGGTSGRRSPARLRLPCDLGPRSRAAPGAGGRCDSRALAPSPPPTPRSSSCGTFAAARASGRRRFPGTPPPLAPPRPPRPRSRRRRPGAPRSFGPAAAGPREGKPGPHGTSARSSGPERPLHRLPLRMLLLPPRAPHPRASSPEAMDPPPPKAPPFPPAEGPASTASSAAGPRPPRLGRHLLIDANGVPYTYTAPLEEEPRGPTPREAPPGEPGPRKGY
ncbi:hypothetical protein CapIbe_015043, partial [Capra ibex]